MNAKGTYWGNFYIPIEYRNNEPQIIDVISHELSHALLTEATNHGLAYKEFSSLSSENLRHRNLIEVMKILQDSSERTEECFAVLIPLISSCENNEQLLEKYRSLQETEYYYRYSISEFEKILFSDVTLKEKKHLIENILFACMNTNIFAVNCDWLSKEKVYQLFIDNAQLLIPDRRLVLILEWINETITDHSIFFLSESDIYEKALRMPIPPNNGFTIFQNKLIAMADRNGLAHNYTSAHEIVQYYDDVPDIYSVDRVYFHIDDSDYVAYGVDIPNLELLECDTVLFFPLEKKEYLIFTSNSRKEKYKLELPLGSLSNQLFEHFSGIIIAYLDDISLLRSKITTNKRIVYKSVCNYVQLEKLLSAQNIHVERAGIFQFDDYIGTPFFEDKNGVYYCGGPRSLEVLSHYTNHFPKIYSPDSFVLNSNITSHDFQLITSSDIAIDDDKSKRIATFNGSLDAKIFSVDAGIDTKEICGYYFDIFEQFITSRKWDDAQSLFNFMLNLLDNDDDRRLALLQIDNIVTKCKRAMMHDIKKDAKLLQKYVDLYSMTIQGYRLLNLPVENICITLTNLANLYLECYQAKSANEYATLVLKLRTDIWGADSPKLARSHYLLGTTFLYSDKAKAKECFSTAKKLATMDKDLRLLSAIEVMTQYLS